MDRIDEIYLEDCVKGMQRYPDNYFDLAIVDPPYGGNDAIGIKNSGKKHDAKRKDYKIFENVAPDDSYFLELLRVSKKQIIWGINFYNTDLLNSPGRIVWDKKGTAFGRAELAYYSHSKSVNVFDYVWNGMIQQDMKNKELRIHPTQKPVKLYEWLLTEYADKEYKILDTHLGSASSRIACHNLGYDFVGFEIDAEYYSASQKRYKEVTAQTKLF